MSHADDMNAIGLYGLVAEFEDPNTLVAASRRAVRRATAAWTPTRRSRSRNCTRRSASTTPACR